jgi:hypothetical protein
VLAGPAGSRDEPPAKGHAPLLWIAPIDALNAKIKKAKEMRTAAEAKIAEAIALEAEIEQDKIKAAKQALAELGVTPEQLLTNFPRKNGGL